MLIAKNDRILSTPDRKKCLYLYGGHNVYFNTEFGGLWCYRCGSAWECDPPVILTEARRRAKMKVRLSVYKDERGEWRWRAVARNNRVVGTSEEGYKRRSYAARKALTAFPEGELADEPRGK